ncbi:MAG: hypothetical protein K0B08_04565 [Bacteroidales bacterium]|nr:hypothetical protein [Bacteroidales bacterium]
MLRIWSPGIDHVEEFIVLCLNRATEADIKLTRKLKDAGIWLDLPVLDHLIISSEGYYSFADEGLL